MDLCVVDGTPSGKVTITVEVTIDGSPAADVPIEVEGEVVGRTDDDSTLIVTLPEYDVRVRAETDDQHAELNFEFDD
ncbi:MAG: hypothetical protein V5A27_01610 [Halapricum sp.]